MVEFPTAPEAAMKNLAAAPLALALLAGPALADEILLKNGRSLEGKVTESGEVVVFEKAGLRMELRRDEVSEIRRSPSPKEEYAKRREAQEKLEAAKEYLRDCKADAADAHHRLGLFCATKGLKDEAKAEQERAIALDPEHAGARRALGFVKTEKGWRPEDEVMKEKGFVRAEGGWVTKEEADALAKGGEPSAREKERRAKKEQERAMRKSLNTALRMVADSNPDTRARGEKRLVDVARAMADPGLEANAPEIRNYYDTAYQEIDRARALVQVHAQVVTLKRPIKTLSTSLGGFSSPVTLQLPELSVISINTTALLPLSVDED
jgi:tetratricopeptide (TPR) repeat protein